MKDRTSSSSSADSPDSRLQATGRWANRSPVILLAEDDLADQELVRRAFEGHRCDVRMVNDGVALLEYLTCVEDNASGNGCVRPDIILLDLNMPRMDGRDALRLVRSTHIGSIVPIIVFSTSNDVSDVSRCYREGCNSYVTKPADLDDYNKTLQNIAAYWLDFNVLP